MVRTWKNLKAFGQQQKQLKAQTLAVLRDEKLRKQSYFKATFDCMKVNKEEEKYARIYQYLHEVEMPRTE